MALTPEEILADIDEIIKIWKPFNDNLSAGKKKKNEGKFPPYYPIYNTAVDYFMDIRVHAEKGVFPKKLFAKRSPNQTQEEFDYVKDNYKQKTQPVFMDFLNVVNRSFNEGNWTLDHPENEDGEEVDDKGFRKYIEDEIPVHGSLENFMKNVLPSIKLKDANGVIAVRPEFVPRDEDGNFLNGELIDPVPLYYRSDQVVKMKDGDYFYIELDEKSWVNHGNQRKKIGKIFDIYDDESIWRATQVGKFNDFTFEIESIFQHNIGEVPVTRLMGVQQIVDNEILYQSPFLFAVDCLDLVALNASNLQLSINNCVYPYRVMIGNICDFEDDNGGKCDGGDVFNDEDGTTYRCPACHGSGLKSRLTPLGTLLIKPPTEDEPVGEAGITEPMQFVSPPTESLEFLVSQVQRDLDLALKILHIKDTTSQAQGSEDISATSDAIEQKQMFTFLKPISDQIFFIWSFTMDAIGFMRYGSGYKEQQPTLIAPITFDFFTQEDYLRMINEAVEAGLPSYVIHPLVFKYLSTLFYNDADTAKAFGLIVNTDRLLTLRDEIVAAKVAAGTALKWEEILHSSAIQLVKELVMEDPNFFEQDMAAQQEKLRDKAKEILKEIDESRPKFDTNSLVDALANSGKESEDEDDGDE